MTIDPLSMMGESLLDQVDAALKGMVDDLVEADRGVIGVTRQAALEWDKAVAEGKGLSAMTYLAYVTKGLESLGGSVAARKALGKKPADKPKTGLAGVRNLRAVPDAKTADGATAPKAPATRKPRAPRKPKAT
jgi:hypothetical protein